METPPVYCTPRLHVALSKGAGEVRDSLDCAARNLARVREPADDCACEVMQEESFHQIRHGSVHIAKPSLGSIPAADITSDLYRDTRRSFVPVSGCGWTACARRSDRAAAVPRADATGKHPSQI